METADYITMFWSAQDMGVQALLLYLTVSSGYLVVAYIVGNELTRSQALFVSGLFLVFALYALWGVGQYWSIGDEARIALEGLGADTIGLNYLRLNPAVIAFPMGLLGIFGSLKFMWDIRQRRTD